MDLTIQTWHWVLAQKKKRPEISTRDKNKGQVIFHLPYTCVFTLFSSNQMHRIRFIVISEKPKDNIGKNLNSEIVDNFWKCLSFASASFYISISLFKSGKHQVQIKVQVPFSSCEALYYNLPPYYGCIY